MSSVSVIIPTFNEEETIGKVLLELTKFSGDYGWEVIVVNDASTDDTAKIAEEYKGVKLLNHYHHKGYGASLKTGIRESKNDIIMIMDSDGQHNPSDINKLLECMDQADMVVGAREDGKSDEWIRRPGKLLLKIVANYLAETKIPDINSGFRAIKKKCIEEFMHILPNNFSFSTTITLAMFKAGYNIRYVPIKVGSRRSGRSAVKQLRDGPNVILLIIRCISLFNPLKVYLPAAAGIFTFGLLFSLYGVVRFHSFPKSAIVFMLTAVIIFFFGILADQISAIRRSPK